MSAQEKAEYEKKQLQKELDELKAKDALAEMTKTARKMLSDAEITIPDELLAVMVTTDADGTKRAVEGFRDMFKSAVQEAVKLALKGSAPRAGASSKTITKDEIMTIKDPAERKRLIAENIDLFQRKGR